MEIYTVLTEFNVPMDNIVAVKPHCCAKQTPPTAVIAEGDARNWRGRMSVIVA
jgi:hypothetical protein